MKKVIYLLYFILLMILYHFTRNTNMFLLTISFSLLLLFNSIFSTMNIKNKIQEYYDNKYYYSNKKILKGSIIFIGIITIILMLISYLIGLLINIKGITLVNISMCIYIFTNNIIKLESEYFSIGKYKKLGNNLINVYKITNIILTIITIIILYKVLNLDNYINISILYLISLLPFIIFNLLFYFIIFKNNKCSKKREENKINYIKVIKKSIITNKIKVLYSIITSSYFYTSIIMLYFLLINKYNYTYDVVGTYITNTYLYGLIIIYFIYLFIKNNYIDKFNMLLDKIKNKARKEGIQLVDIPIRHLGTEKAHELYKKIEDYLEENNIEMKFETIVEDLIIKENKIEGVKVKNTKNEKEELYANKVVLAVGRKGANWLSDICIKHNINTKTGIVDIGIRYELPDEIMKDINKYMYEGKFIGKPGPFKDKVRTFCQNPSGFVSSEVYDNNLTLVNGITDGII